MNPPKFPSGPALAIRRRPQKREGAPGKVRQLKLSAAMRDKIHLREWAAGCKDSVSAKGTARDE